MRKRDQRRLRVLGCERLESRCVLSALLGDSSVSVANEELGEFRAMIVAGDPNGSPADSPANRVDPNTTSSPFAGVGSLRIDAQRGTYICTATPITPQYVLTAGHCLDLNNDGKSNKKDGIRAVYFQLNFGGDLTHKIQAATWTLHPDFTGFNRPSVNDDLAIVEFASPLPPGVPTYSLPASNLAAGTTLVMVGYGRSGDGVNGYYVNASFSVKRTGENNADAFYGQDDAGRPAVNEVFRFDFDGPTGNGSFGGSTLGNNVETTLGGGDSGGPSFRIINGEYILAGVNTFTQGLNAPKFGSLGGGINVFPYLSWINSVLTRTSLAAADGSGGGQGKSASSTIKVGFSAVDASLAMESLHVMAQSNEPFVWLTASAISNGPRGDVLTATTGQTAKRAEAALAVQQARALLPSRPTLVAEASGRSLAWTSQSGENAAESDEWTAAADTVLASWHL